jgi:hypothetical protein
MIALMVGFFLVLGFIATKAPDLPGYEPEPTYNEWTMPSL